MSKAKRLGLSSRSKRKAGQRGKKANCLYPMGTRYHRRNGNRNS